MAPFYRQCNVADELTDLFGLPVYLRIPYKTERTGIGEGNGEQEFLIAGNDLVPVDPTALDIIYIVVKYEFVDSSHQLEIPDIGAEVWLHYRYFHFFQI